MASVKPYFDTRSERKDGTYPLKLAVTHKGSFTVNLKIYLKKNQWDGVQIVNHPQKRKLNQGFSNKLQTAKTNIINLHSSGEIRFLSNKELKLIIQTGDIKAESNESGYKLAEHFKRYIAAANKPKTAETYQYTLDKINLFSEGVMFNEVDYGWLKEFERFLSTGSGINARSIHLRNIRAVFNDAIKYRLVSQNIYPFREFKIKSEKTAKRSLTVEELNLIRFFPVEPHQEKYRDFFMLVFYLIGINVIDLVNLKEIKNGRINYKREKTGKQYDIKVLPEAMELIEKYKGSDFLLFPMDGYSDYRDFRHRLNENLKEIGFLERKGPGGKKIRTPFFTNLSTYWARHSWATIASKNGVPKDVISAALGHEIGSKTTSIYIDYDQDLVDKANRKVVDYLNKSSCLNPYVLFAKEKTRIDFERIDL
ncbi:site-specific integrase [Sunxiuqinia indica]|uniref:site-specific integrase n=1 Tax=Sunxiuqinia indica TaxID=2692584 RepID=UPI00135C0F6A|nr:site-specific integrase [Sunxiuqinia indica]